MPSKLNSAVVSICFRLHADATHYASEALPLQAFACLDLCVPMRPLINTLLQQGDQSLNASILNRFNGFIPRPALPFAIGHCYPRSGITFHYSRFTFQHLPRRNAAKAGHAPVLRSAFDEGGSRSTKYL